MTVKEYQLKNTGFKKRNYRRFFLFLFLILFTGALAAGGGWVYLNYDRLLFYFKHDKYSELIDRISTLEDRLLTEGSTGDLSDEELSSLLESLAVDHGSDGYLYYLKGRYHHVLFRASVREAEGLYRDLFFRIYLDRYNFFESLDRENWQNALLSLRKALALGIPGKEAKHVASLLASLYLWGGKPYWQSGRTLLREYEIGNSEAGNLYRILFGRKTPDWQSIGEKHPDELITFFKGLYALRNGNTPGGFSYLKKLSDSENTALKNNALYLTAYTRGRFKRQWARVYHYRRIELDEFLQRNPWFLAEFNYWLRFLGQRREAAALLRDYAKKVGET